jgi:hypothetical protein
MPRVTITLEDVVIDGKLGTKVVLDPSYEHLMQKATSVALRTSAGSNAEALAMHAARAILDAQNAPGESLIIRVPGLGR